MILKIMKNKLMIVSEDEQDEAFIEDTLKLKKTGDKLVLTRQNTKSLGLCDVRLLSEENNFEKEEG